jgi:hypothetical protein
MGVLNLAMVCGHEAVAAMETFERTISPLEARLGMFRGLETLIIPHVHKVKPRALLSLCTCLL